MFNLITTGASVVFLERYLQGAALHFGMELGFSVSLAQWSHNAAPDLKVTGSILPSSSFYFEEGTKRPLGAAREAVQTTSYQLGIEWKNMSLWSSGQTALHQTWR